MVTYQGSLRDQSDFATGPVDFQFTLWSEETNGSQISAVLPLNAVEIANGLFSVKLDFGADNSL